MFSASKSSAPAGGAITLSKSLRFRNSASAYLNRTFSTPTNSSKWTYSTWLKRGTLSSTNNLFLTGPYTASAYANSRVQFSSSGTLNYFDYNSGYSIQLVSTAVYVDPSAWYNIVVAVDTTQATSTNRVKIYVNGNQITAFNTATYPTQNFVTQINSAQAHYFGYGYPAEGGYFDGYFSDVYFIDGQQLTPSSFGATDATTGQWVPAKYTGTYGTNGFHLPFNITGNSTYYGSFNGSNQYLTVADNAVLNMGSSNFTIEGWYYPLANVPASSGIFSKRANGGVVGGILFYMSTLGLTPRLLADIGGSWGVDFTASSGFTLNQWNHFAVVRNSSTWTIYINGISVGTTTNSGTVTTNTAAFGIAVDDAIRDFAPVNAYISNFRVVKGTAVYTANFTPSTAPLTAITNTSLLTLQNSSIVDNSGNSLSITNTGTVTTTSSTSVFDGVDIAADTSGNANNWRTNNISLTAGSTYDSMNDVPTLTSATVANYAVLNPLYGSASTITNGNLTVTITAATTAYASISFTTGKWYWEITESATITGSYLGVMDSTYIKTDSLWSSQARTYVDNGNKYNGTSTAYGATYANGDVIGVAVDMSAGTIVFYKNNTSQGIAFSDLAGKEWRPMFYAGAATQNVNFGQQPFTYTPPSGYNAVNTYNLSAPTIAQGNKYMDATLYTGNGGTQSITNAGGFQPDFAWIKDRNTTANHQLIDSVRGAGYSLFSNTTDATTNYTAYFTSFATNGFNLAGGTGAFNNNGDPYVGWQWKAGGTAVSNTSGSITSSVSANTTAGFSIVTYTGTGSNATVGHGLGVAPSMIIIKCRNASGDIWPVYHVSIGNTQYLRLNGTNGAGTYNEWQNTTPTSSVFYISNDTVLNTNGNTYVAYCFAPVTGYSAFGSYTGNKSTTGPFVYLGFRPKFIMFKNSSSVGGDWNILDTSRSPYNVMNSALQPNGNYAEASNSNYTMNYYSNGFQIGTINDELNSSGGIIIYMAFAENPFKYANAR